MSGGDGTDFSTQVSVVRGPWVLAILSYHIRH
jgi:hypothetical protein